MKADIREKRSRRVRAKISGTREIPRLVVFKSNKHVSAQAIDDVAGVTLVFIGDAHLEKDLQAKPPRERAHAIGRTVGEALSKEGITQVRFDRAGYPYTGIVAAVASGAREAGLKL